jgi:TonB family protein
MRCSLIHLSALISSLAFSLFTVGCGGCTGKGADQPPHCAETPHERQGALEREPAAAPEPAPAPAPEPAPVAAKEPVDDPEATPTPSENDPGNTETRTQEVIRQTFQRNRPQARACFDEALKKHAGLKGNLTVSFTIDPKGAVKEASINTDRSDLAIPELNTCIIDVVRKIAFPPSSRGFESKGNYPYTFTPGG